MDNKPSFGDMIEVALRAHLGQDEWSRRDVDINYSGTQITLPNSPAPMPLRTAISALERKAKDEETLLDVHEFIDAFPEDALVAINTAMRVKYGWASPTPKAGFFGPTPPNLITVKTGPRAQDVVQVPFGRFTLPGVENPIDVHRSSRDGQPCLVITGSVRKREASVLEELAQLAREILKTNSIYKGKAIRLQADEDGDLDITKPPQFLDTSHIKLEDLILNPDEMEQVQATLWAAIQHTDACVRHKIPLNRGVLLEGTCGTGKTMTANATSKVCVDNGWTYILLDDVRALEDALLFAQRYQPAVVFAEDVDRVAEHRDQRGNDLLNVIDGVLTKNSQVFTVLTTNHVDRLDNAMLRPGRLDAVITVRPPERDAVVRLLQTCGRELIDPQEDLSAVGDALAGNIPATIREVVERSKLVMISKGHERVKASDLLTAAAGMERHLKLLQGVKEDPTPEHVLGEALGKLLQKHTAGGDAEDELVESIDSLQQDINRNTNTLRTTSTNNMRHAELMAEKMSKGMDELKAALKVTNDINSKIAKSIKV